jgi:hypothetical protein
MRGGCREKKRTRGDRAQPKINPHRGRSYCALAFRVGHRGISLRQSVITTKIINGKHLFYERGKELSKIAEVSRAMQKLYEYWEYDQKKSIDLIQTNDGEHRPFNTPFIFVKLRRNSDKANLCP